MGHSQAEKVESHDRIVQVAATRFRESGVSGIGVADLMRNAGLTHGGFYRHFASPDELVAHPNRLPQLRAYRRCHRRVASARADLLTMRTWRVHQERQTGEVADGRQRRRDPWRRDLEGMTVLDTLLG